MAHSVVPQKEISRLYEIMHHLLKREDCTFKSAEFIKSTQQYIKQCTNPKE